MRTRKYNPAQRRATGSTRLGAVEVGRKIRFEDGSVGRVERSGKRLVRVRMASRYSRQPREVAFQTSCGETVAFTAGRHVATFALVLAAELPVEVLP